ncbi:hypothetical protein V6N11_001749 [Hibiscus sabdariffa]|uniref:Myb/SANT-like domain-containing protein n=1 Tax=Hibiscus sabdariffa TaxID=183260 RepID=A0ABR2QTB9_9ROSI
MSPCKRKITKDPLATNSEVEKCKAVWDLKATEYFIQGCLDQVSKGERNGTTLTKKGEPKYGKFRNKRFPFYNELTILFKDVTATGEFAWAPSSGILPNGLGSNEGDEDDVYRPSPIDLDMEESSGDSEDASVGATNEFTGINLNSSQGTVNQNSEGKRKRVGQGEKLKKKKVNVYVQIAEGVSVIANSCKSRDVREASTSIGEVLAELQTLDEVANGPVFHTNCCQLMMFKPERETFIGLRGLEEKRMHWLRHAAYNPIPFMKM